MVEIYKITMVIHDLKTNWELGDTTLTLRCEGHNPVVFVASIPLPLQKLQAIFWQLKLPMAVHVLQWVRLCSMKGTNLPSFWPSFWPLYLRVVLSLPATLGFFSSPDFRGGRPPPAWSTEGLESPRGRRFVQVPRWKTYDWVNNPSTRWGWHVEFHVQEPEWEILSLTMYTMSMTRRWGSFR